MQAILRENDKNYRAQPVVYTERATLHMERIHCRPHMPDLLKGLFDVIEQGQTSLSADAATMKSLFPKTFGQPKVVFQPRQGSMALNPLTGRKLIIGAVFSGGPAAGGHNVLTGLLDFMKRRNAESELIGFLGGPHGIVSNNHRVIHANDIESFRNLGGFHFLGSGRTKIETEEQLQSSVNTCRELGLDGLVIIGGDDSNTNAGILAEYFQTKNCHTCVIGVPKTIDGDLRNEDIEASFGFDTATKVYANSVANLCFDAISALKSYHFIRVMGRDASHITLEVALQTHPNLLFISEEVQTKNQTLTGVVDEIVALVVDRANIGKDYGTILIPEGLVGFASDMKLLIEELNDILANEKEAKDPSNFNANLLTPPAKTLYESLPEFILVQMMAERDPHGNLFLSS